MFSGQILIIQAEISEEKLSKGVPQLQSNSPDPGHTLSREEPIENEGLVTI
jgi:hypothetical protein